MCIRDRSGSPTDAEVETVRGAIGIKGVTNRVSAGTINGTCLLYTSDAADERSSVDLGGRRIIKKKKKTDMSEGKRMRTMRGVRTYILKMIARIMMKSSVVATWRC